MIETVIFRLYFKTIFRQTGPWENVDRANVIELQKRHGHWLSTITFGYLSRIIPDKHKVVTLLINYRANLT